MKVLTPFESTVEQTTETMPPAPPPKKKKKQLLTSKSNYKVERAATLLTTRTKNEHQFD